MHDAMVESFEQHYSPILESHVNYDLTNLEYRGSSCQWSRNWRSCPSAQLQQPNDGRGMDSTRSTEYFRVSSGAVQTSRSKFHLDFSGRAEHK